MEITYPRNKFDNSTVNICYRKYLENESRYFILYGGAGSGKSYFAAQKILFRMLYENHHKILLIRKVAKTIRNSQFSLLKTLISDSNLSSSFRFRESDLSITNKLNSNTIISVGVDDREKLKSIHGITSIWIEEATELSKKDFVQIDLRLRNRTSNYKQIIMTFNPVDANHWLHNTHLNNSETVKTTFKDNPYLDNSYIDVLNNLKNEDKEYYDIYALGNWGTLKNIIFKPFEILQKYPLHFDETIYGLDFGYNNPTALIKVKIKDGCYYTDELIYGSKMTNSDLVNLMNKTIKNKTDMIFCDPAEPDRIKELEIAGFNVHPALKNVKDGIDFMKSQKIFSKPGNQNLNKEVLSYSYKTDRNGNIYDEPVKFNDHALDALRYALYTHCRDRNEMRIRRI
jgi:phage terminase large subunit